MESIQPQVNESPLDFVERADTHEVDGDVISECLAKHFGLQDRAVKELKLKSRVFWNNFYKRHSSELRARGGSRYSALKFIERKNGQCGQQKLTDTEIQQLVDSVGPWTR